MSRRDSCDPAAELDPITLEIIGNAFSSIAEEMGEVLVRASTSTNIKERRDCSTALIDPAGNVVCQAEHIPMHLGSFIDVVPKLLAHYELDEIRPDDVFIANDPYEGGATHLPDIVIIQPIFADGRLVLWAANTGHHADFVDRGNAHIFQEGLRIPPLRLYSGGELQTDIERLILVNCQAPDERRHDLRAQVGANRLANQRVNGLAERYGVQLLLSASRALQDYAERRMRIGIAQIPDGVYRFSDTLETAELEEEFGYSVEITVVGDEVNLEFESPLQVRGSINVTYGALLASVLYAMKSVVDPGVPANAGLARPIRVSAQPGTMLNCSYPAAVNGRLQPCQRVVDIIFGALALAVPDRVTAAGNGACASVTFVGSNNADRRLWIYLEAIGGGGGARAKKDGLDGVHVHMTNTSNLPVEALETEFPVTVLRYELIEESGGAGRYRGGRGLLRVFRVESDCQVRVGGSRLRSAPWGLSGGGPGAKGSFRIASDINPTEKAATFVSAGEIVEIRTPGGGGFGTPPGDQIG